VRHKTASAAVGRWLGAQAKHELTNVHSSGGSIMSVGGGTLALTCRYIQPELVYCTASTLPATAKCCLKCPDMLVTDLGMILRCQEPMIWWMPSGKVKYARSQCPDVCLAGYLFPNLPLLSGALQGKRGCNRLEPSRTATLIG
jgi:hypothetical protein